MIVLHEHLFHLQSIRKIQLQKLEDLCERNISDISNSIYSEGLYSCKHYLTVIAQFISQNKCGLSTYNPLDSSKFKSVLENAQVEDFPPSQPPPQIPLPLAPTQALASANEQKPKQNIFSSYANTSTASRNNNRATIPPRGNF